MRAHKRGWAGTDDRPLPVFEDGWVDAGDPVYRDQERFGKLVRRLDDPYPYEGGEMIEANKKLLALSIDQHMALGALRTAQKQRHTADLDNLARGNTVKKQREKRLYTLVLSDVKKVWLTVPSRGRSVNNITKILCNPKGTKRDLTPKMELWKYRWSYKGERRTERFPTLYRYVKRAIKALNPASA